MSGTRSRWLALALAAVTIFAAVAVGGAAPVLAQDDPDPIPAAYYGTVEIDGEPAPAGAELTAHIDGEQRGSITLDEGGTFGAAGADEAKLTVAGSSDDEGKEVTFRIGGEVVEPSTPVEWQPTDVRELSLSGEDIDLPNFQVEIDSEATTTEVPTDTDASIVANIENVGDAGEQEVALAIDGEVAQVATVELDAGESRSATFQTAFEAEGEYDAVVASPQDSDHTVIDVNNEHDDPDPPGEPGPGLPPGPPGDGGESDIQVTEASLGSEQVDVGEAVDVDATFENLGDASGLHVASLMANGDEMASELVSLDAGESTSVAFATSFDEAGEYTISVDGTQVGTVTVGSADISVADASVSDDELSTGDAVDVTGTVENAGDVAGDATVELRIDGETVDTQTVTVDPGATADVTFTHTFDDEGEYDIALNDASAGTVSVSAQDDGTGDDGNWLPMPGFTPAVAIIALLAVIAIGRFRVD